jgi:hypothetical protein
MNGSLASADFQRSYLEYESYPLNLTRNAIRISQAALEKYKTRLDAIAADLCLQDEKDVLLPIRDIYGSTPPGTRQIDDQIDVMIFTLISK